MRNEAVGGVGGGGVNSGRAPPVVASGGTPPSRCVSSPPRPFRTAGCARACSAVTSQGERTRPRKACATSSTAADWAANSTPAVELYTAPGPSTDAARTASTSTHNLRAHACAEAGARRCGGARLRARRLRGTRCTGLDKASQARTSRRLGHGCVLCVRGKVVGLLSDPSNLLFDGDRNDRGGTSNSAGSDIIRAMMRYRLLQPHHQSDSSPWDVVA